MANKGANDRSLNASRASVRSSWALMAAPGHDPSLRHELRSRAAAARRPPRPDTRLAPVWDPRGVRIAAFAAARAPNADFSTVRRSAVVALKCSSALMRHTEAASASQTVTAVDALRAVVPLPGDPDAISLDPAIGLLVTGLAPDKASAMVGSPDLPSFLILRDSDPAACPVRALLRYLRHPEVLRRARDTSHLLASISRRNGRFFPIGSDAVSHTLRDALSAVGISGPRVAARSRAAVANELLRSGLSQHAVCCLGRWAPGSSAFEIFYRKIDLQAACDAVAAASGPVDLQQVLGPEAAALVEDELP